MSAVARHLLISGRVQGVFFRGTLQAEARAAGVVGWARNLPDGKVEAFVQGDEAAVQRVVDWCRHGPPEASVRRVDVMARAPDPTLDGFQIERTPSRW